jgi:hypothetical protein
MPTQPQWWCPGVMHAFVSRDARLRLGRDMHVCAIDDPIQLWRARAHLEGDIGVVKDVVDPTAHDLLISVDSKLS